MGIKLFRVEELCKISQEFHVYCITFYHLNENETSKCYLLLNFYWWACIMFGFLIGHESHCLNAKFTLFQKPFSYGSPLLNDASRFHFNVEFLCCFGGKTLPFMRWLNIYLPFVHRTANTIHIMQTWNYLIDEQKKPPNALVITFGRLT